MIKQFKAAINMRNKLWQPVLLEIGQDPVYVLDINMYIC